MKMTLKRKKHEQQNIPGLDNQVQISSILAKVVCGTTVDCSIGAFKRQVREDEQKKINLYQIG